MVRGKAKADAQAKNAQKMADMAKKGSQKDAQKAGEKANCPICRVPFAAKAQMLQHYDSKHPKETPPDPASLGLLK